MNNNIPQGMKPFNIQEWQNGAKPICRNGYEPTDLHYFESANMPLAYVDKDGDINTCSENGFFQYDASESVYDIFLKS